MNHQTTSPLSVRLAASGGMNGHSIEANGGTMTLAFVHGTNEGSTTNARLLAASFNAFDRAGRELGIDAAALAESIDLAGLLLAASQMRAVHGPAPDVAEGVNSYDAAWLALDKALNTVPGPIQCAD